MRELAADTWTILVKTAEKRLAEAERLLEKGKRREAFNLLKPLVRAFADTELKDRIETLVQELQGVLRTMRQRETSTEPHEAIDQILSEFDVKTSRTGLLSG